MLENRTGIIIAHRLATVQRADEIMVVEEGRIAEHGLRADLAADAGSRYARLLAAGEQNTMLERGARWQGARMTEKNR